MAHNLTQNSVDCIFDLDGKYTVLVKRAKEPFKDMWAIPGGRQEVGESLEEAVVREVREETGVKIELMTKNIPYKVMVNGDQSLLEQVWTYNSGTDPRGGNTTVYAVKLKPDAVSLKAGKDIEEARVFRGNEIPELAFDHNQFLMDYFKKLKRFNNPLPTTDVIIEYNGGIVMIERKNPPFGLAIPGGFAEYGLSYEQNAVKEAKEETGLEVTLKNPGHPFVYSAADRDPRGHMTSCTYVAVGSGKLVAGDDAKGAHIFSPPELLKEIENGHVVFDHPKILMDYLRREGHVK